MSKRVILILALRNKHLQTLHCSSNKAPARHILHLSYHSTHHFCKDPDHMYLVFLQENTDIRTNIYHIWLCTPQKLRSTCHWGKQRCLETYTSVPHKGFPPPRTLTHSTDHSSFRPHHIRKLPKQSFNFQHIIWLSRGYM